MFRDVTNCRNFAWSASLQGRCNCDLYSTFQSSSFLPYIDYVPYRIAFFTKSEFLRESLAGISQMRPEESTCP